MVRHWIMAVALVCVGFIRPAAAQTLPLGQSYKAAPVVAETSLLPTGQAQTVINRKTTVDPDGKIWIRTEIATQIVPSGHKLPDLPATHRSNRELTERIKQGKQPSQPTADDEQINEIVTQTVGANPVPNTENLLRCYQDLVEDIYTAETPEPVTPVAAPEVSPELKQNNKPLAQPSPPIWRDEQSELPKPSKATSNATFPVKDLATAPPAPYDTSLVLPNEEGLYTGTIGNASHTPEPTAEQGLSRASLFERVLNLNNEKTDLQLRVNKLEQELAFKQFDSHNNSDKEIDDLRDEQHRLKRDNEELLEKSRNAQEELRRTRAQVSIPVPAGIQPGSFFALMLAAIGAGLFLGRFTSGWEFPSARSHRRSLERDYSMFGKGQNRPDDDK